MFVKVTGTALNFMKFLEWFAFGGSFAYLFFSLNDVYFSSPYLRLSWICFFISFRCVHGAFGQETKLKRRV